MAVISGWNGLDGSMGPGGHVRCLYLVMGAMTGVHNGSKTPHGACVLSPTEKISYYAQPVTDKDHGYLYLISTYKAKIL